MKYLLLLAILVIAYLVWRNARVSERDAEDDQRGAGGRAAPGAPQEMVSCQVCGLHLPKADAVAGSRGLHYCSQEHRRIGGG